MKQEISHVQRHVPEKAKNVHLKSLNRMVSKSQQELKTGGLNQSDEEATDVTWGIGSTVCARSA